MKKRVIKKSNVTKFHKSSKPIRNILIGAVLIILLILAAIIIKTTLTGKAIDPLNPQDPLGVGINPDQFQNKIDNPTQTTNEASNYLSQEWGKILSNSDNPLVMGIWAIHKSLTFLSPVFKIVIGIEYSASWLFALTLTIWIFLLVYIFRLFSIFSIYSKTTSIIISLGMTIIISIVGFTKFLSEKIIGLISLSTTWWMQLILIAIIIVCFILASMFSGGWTEMVKRWKEISEKNKEKKDIAEAKSKAETSEKVVKSLSEAFTGGEGI